MWFTLVYVKKQPSDDNFYAKRLNCYENIIHPLNHNTQVDPLLDIRLNVKILVLMRICCESCVSFDEIITMIVEISG
jgi:hypothetical protein